MSLADPTIEAPQPPAGQIRKRPLQLQSRKAQLLLACLLAAGLSLSLYLALPWCQKFWQFCLQSLINWLPLPETKISQVNIWQTFQAPILLGELPEPDYHAWIGNLSASLLLYLLAGLLRPSLRTSLRALAAFHAFGVLAQGISGKFTYTLTDHSLALSTFSIGLLLCLPLVMAATHYIVERNFERRILATALIAAFLILSLPLKLATHLALLHLLSPLAMPTLFLVFGPALDILGVSALYAWAVTWRNKTA